MSMIPDPSKRGSTPYDVLGLDQDADRNAVKKAYAAARRDRSKDSRQIAEAHEQLERAGPRLRTDFLFYEVSDPPDAALAGLPNVDLSELPVPLPPIPVKELLDARVLLDALPGSVAAIPPRPSGVRATRTLPLRFDR